MINMDQITAHIGVLLQSRNRISVAIDGRCAAGKTTLAETLRQFYQCTVIHMDDFFLRPEQRTPERLQTPGGNIDYERFSEEVLLPLQRSCAFSYRPWRCSSQQLGAPIFVNPSPLTIVEGSYSCHPLLGKYYDFSVFLTVSPQEQLQRISVRNNKSAEVFREKWIPMEEQYFQAFSVKENSDLMMDTSTDVFEELKLKR